MTAAISGFGTLLKVGDGATPTEAFTTVAEVMDITGPGITQRTVEVTAHDGTGWDESIGTINEGGELTFDVNYVPTNATHNATAGLLNDLENNTVRNFQLVFPDGSSTTWSFAALVTRFQPGAPVNGALRGSLTLKITGQPTLA